MAVSWDERSSMWKVLVRQNYRELRVFLLLVESVENILRGEEKQLDNERCSDRFRFNFQRQGKMLKIIFLTTSRFSAFQRERSMLNVINIVITFVFFQIISIIKHDNYSAWHATSINSRVYKFPWLRRRFKHKVSSSFNNVAFKENPAETSQAALGQIEISNFLSSVRGLRAGKWDEEKARREEKFRGSVSRTNVGRCPTKSRKS